MHRSELVNKKRKSNIESKLANAPETLDLESLITGSKPELHLIQQGEGITTEVDAQKAPELAAKADDLLTTDSAPTTQEDTEVLVEGIQASAVAKPELKSAKPSAQRATPPRNHKRTWYHGETSNLQLEVLVKDLHQHLGKEVDRSQILTAALNDLVAKDLPEVLNSLKNVGTDITVAQKARRKTLVMGQ